MKIKITLSWLAAVFVLTGAAFSLSADTNTPATPLDYDKLREQLRTMTPEERRAKIEAIRKELAAQFKLIEPPRPVNFQTNIPPRVERLMAGGPEGRIMAFLDRVLTEAQRGSLREVMAAQRDKTRELEGKLQDARKAAIAAGLMEKFDEDTVRTKALEVGKLDAELAVLRAKALAQMKPPLSAEQVEKLKNPPAFNPMPPPPSALLPPSSFQRVVPSRTLRFPVGPRDEHDLPAPPKPE